MYKLDIPLDLKEKAAKTKLRNKRPSLRERCCLEKLRRRCYHFEIGGLHHGLRVIRAGLAPTDTVVIDGIVRARPGAKVTQAAGTIVPSPDSDAE